MEASEAIAGWLRVQDIELSPVRGDEKADALAAAGTLVRLVGLRDFDQLRLGELRKVCHARSLPTVCAFRITKRAALDN